MHEDNAIRQLVRKYGTRSWSVIAERIFEEYSITGRTGKQCRERWHNHLDPRINKEAWTAEEEQIMADAHKALGKIDLWLLSRKSAGNKWSEIAKLLPGRTDNHVKNHWCLHCVSGDLFQFHLRYSFMRRNVRRLNREANDGQPNHKHVNRVEFKPQHGTKIENISRGGRSRKAANLAELRRYFNAAAEAASEVFCTGPDKKYSHDFAKIAEAGIKPLDSPSRMVAVSLATGNIRFREKLREKLEATGGVACKINTSRPDVISIAEDYDRQVIPMPTSRLEMSGDSLDGYQEKSIKSDNDSAVKRRKMSLRVTIDEADNFGLASANSCFRPSADTQISLKRISPCQENDIMASEVGNKERYVSSHVMCTLFSDPLKFDFDEVVAHYP